MSTMTPPATYGAKSKSLTPSVSRKLRESVTCFAELTSFCELQCGRQAQVPPLEASERNTECEKHRVSEIRQRRRG
jgi:hypothetical protein